MSVPILPCFLVLERDKQPLLIVALFVASLLWTLPAAADVNEGERAYRADDFVTAYRELLPAAQAGNAKAQYLLSKVLYWGNGVSGSSAATDRATSYIWLLRAAEQNYGKALEELAQESHDEYDYDQAFQYGLRAAQADGRSGTWLLAFMYCFGEGVPRDSLEADAWQAVSFHPFTHNVAAWQGLQCEVGATVTQEYLMMVNRRAEDIRREYNLPTDF